VLLLGRRLAALHLYFSALICGKDSLFYSGTHDLLNALDAWVLVVSFELAVQALKGGLNSVDSRKKMLLV
jgi:hypothetical protein